jgi:hypothetical protein
VASSQLRACRVVSAPLTHISIVRMCTAGL